MAAVPTDHAARAGVMSALGSALRARFERFGDIADLDEGINVSRSAVAATPVNHPDRSIMMRNLGSAFHTRFQSAGSKGRSRADQRAAMKALRQATMVAAAPPMVRAMSGYEWAQLAARAGAYTQAHRALAYVLDLLPQLVDHGLAPADRRHHLEVLQGLGPLAAQVQLSRPRWAPWRRTSQRADAAWAALEAGRGVLLGQALGIRTTVADLARDNPGLANEVQGVRALLNRDTPQHHDLTLDADDGVLTATDRIKAAAQVAEDRRALASHWNELLHRVRSQPGFDQFGLPPTVAQLRAAAGEGTIVAVNVTAHRCDALVLTASGSGYIPLHGLTQARAVQQTRRFLAAIDQADGRPVDTATIFEVLAWLWDIITAPVLQHLGHNRTPGPGQVWPRIWWLPTGALSFLPLQAAGRHSDDIANPARATVLDRVVSSYTPTARSLYQTRQRHRHSTDTPVGRHGVNPLIVGINTYDNADLSSLILAEAEAMVVHDLLHSRSPALLGKRATRGAVVQALPAAAVAHFACHAKADEDDPAESHLALHDGTLTVAELGSIELTDAYLAFLSACTTATGAIRLPDEAIHIASAFQLAGYTHTIATLWPVADALAPDLAWRFYTAITNGTTPAHAVHDTARAIRDIYPAHPHLWASHIHFGP
jgi:hypothetical protein